MRVFRSSREVESERSSLDRTCSVALSDFSSLVGPYEFHEDDKVFCQLEQNGTVCRQEHWHGWVAKRKDGTEGYIGRNCAAKHFKGDKNFASERARVDREVRKTNLLERLSTGLSDTKLPLNLDRWQQKSREMNDRIKDIKSEFPDLVYKRLADAAKTGNSVVSVEIRYPEKDDNGREYSRWQLTTVGRLMGLNGLDEKRLLPINRAIQAAKKALSKAKVSSEVTPRQLQNWVNCIEGAQGVDALLGEVQRDLDAFLQPENTKLLCWLVRSENVQRDLVRTVLTWKENQRPTSARVESTWREWRGAISSANGGRDFRIP